MERTREMLDAVGRTNERIEALFGPNPIVCIIYAGGAAHLLNTRGETIFEFEDWDDPAFACDVAYSHLEDRLWLLLQAPFKYGPRYH